MHIVNENSTMVRLLIILLMACMLVILSSLLWGDESWACDVYVNHHCYISSRRTTKQTRRFSDFTCCKLKNLIYPVFMSILQGKAVPRNSLTESEQFQKPFLVRNLPLMMREVCPRQKQTIEGRNFLFKFESLKSEILLKLCLNILSFYIHKESI